MKERETDEGLGLWRSVMVITKNCGIKETKIDC